MASRESTAAALPKQLVNQMEDFPPINQNYNHTIMDATYLLNAHRFSLWSIYWDDGDSDSRHRS